MPEWVLAVCDGVVGEPAEQPPAGGHRGRRAGTRAGSNSPNPTGVTPRAAATAIDLASEREQDRQRRGSAKLSDIEFVRQRRSEQHRAIGQLAPQIAPDVVGEDGVGLELRSRACISRVRSRTAAVDLADDHGAAIAVENLAGAMPVGAEVDEATHGARRRHAPLWRSR